MSHAPKKIVPVIGLLALGLAAQMATAVHAHGLLVRIDPGAIDAFDARHHTVAFQLGPDQNLYWVVQGNGRTDNQLLQEVGGDGTVQAAELNAAVNLIDDQSGVSVLNDSGISVSHMAGALSQFSGADAYRLQPAVNTIDGVGSAARATGRGVVIALIDNGVDPENAVLEPVLLNGYNFYSRTPNWSCYADLSAADFSSEDQSGVSVLNSEQENAWGDQSGVSVLSAVELTVFDDNQDDQSGVSVLNDAGGTASSISIDAGVVTSGDEDLYNLLRGEPEIGHGTAVAGLLHLVAPDAMLLPIKAFGPEGTADLATVVAGIYYAVARGANVINMSFSSASSSRELHNALQYAWQHHVVLVAAAGNEAASTAFYPEAYPSVLGVAALGTDTDPLALAGFSNYGPTVKVAAPGYNLVTTFADNAWASVAGTSFSAPLVAGEAALLVEYLRSAAPPEEHPVATPPLPVGAIDAIILTTADPHIPADAHHAVGAGVIQVDRALQSPQP